MLVVRKNSLGLCLLFVGSLATSLVSAEQSSPPKSHRFEEHLTIDWGYAVSYWRDIRQINYYREMGKRRAVAVVNSKEWLGAQGFFVAIGGSVTPWVGFSADLRLQEFFTDNRNMVLEEAGVIYRQRGVYEFGAYAEFRPWQRNYGSRRGVYFLIGGHGGGLVVSKQRDSRVPAEDVKIDERDNQFIGGWSAAGYRFQVAPGVSLHVSGDVGVYVELAYVGLQIGGGLW
jgi:hypothetical protein